MTFVLALFAIITLPAGAEPNLAPQGIVDSAISSILSTPTGQKALCPFTETTAAMDLYIGASRPVAARIQAVCGGRFITPVTRQTVQTMASVVLDVSPQTPGKKFYTYGFQPDLKDIQSYTNKSNATFFLMLPQEMQGPEFIRSLAHEYAMSYDQFARLGYLIDPTTWDQGLNAAFGRPLYTVDTVFEKLPNVQEISCAIRDPAIRYALATERAFRFEDRVIAELGLSSVSPAVASSNFTAALRRLSSLYTKFSVLIAWEQNRYNIACGKPASAKAARAQEIERRAALLERTTLRYRGSEKTIRMQDLLLEPHVGPFMRDLDGGGPRPRGGGYGDGD